MLLVDDIVLFRFKSILYIFREIHQAAIQGQEQEGQRIRQDLSQLYLSRESGAIDEATFDGREEALLDRLDVLEARDGMIEAASEDDDDEDDVENGGEDDEPDADPAP